MKGVKFEVSDSFIKIWKRIHKRNVADEIKRLEKRELYILILCCLDNINDMHDVVIKNLRAVRKELLLVDKMTDRAIGAGDGRPSSCPILEDLYHLFLGKDSITLRPEVDIVGTNGVPIGGQFTDIELVAYDRDAALIELGID